MYFNENFFLLLVGFEIFLVFFFFSCFFLLFRIAYWRRALHTSINKFYMCTSRRSAVAGQSRLFNQSSGLGIFAVCSLSLFRSWLLLLVLLLLFLHKCWFTCYVWENSTWNLHMHTTDHSMNVCTAQSFGFGLSRRTLFADILRRNFLFYLKCIRVIIATIRYIWI